jgi:hypothetical protein
MARVFVSDLPHVDAWFTTISAAAAYDAGLQAAAKRGLDGHAAEEWAADFMDRVVMETAQPNTDYARSALEIQKSGDSVQWMLWPYASEPRLRATKDALALRDMLSPATTGDRSRALRVLMANRLMALTTAAVIYSWSQATRKEEDEDRAHDDWRWWALMSITGHFGGVPVVGDMAEHVAAMVTGQRAPVSGIPIARDVMAAIQSISKALKDGENMDGDQWFKLATSLAKGAGVLDQRLALFAQIANLATSVKGLASNLAESPEEAGEQRELQKLAREQREWQDNRKLDLDKAEKELRALPEAERWKALAERHADDPETMRELLSRLRAPALEPDEARLRKFAVDGGFRARAIAAVVKQRKLDQAATAELLGRLRAKRVLVPAMEADLKKALEADGN